MRRSRCSFSSPPARLFSTYAMRRSSGRSPPPPGTVAVALPAPRPSAARRRTWKRLWRKLNASSPRAIAPGTAMRAPSELEIDHAAHDQVAETHPAEREAEDPARRRPIPDLAVELGVQGVD